MEKKMTRDQHYVPQFYLRNFTDERGEVWIYEPDNNRIFSAKPKSICFEKDLYETQFQNENTPFGKYLLPNNIENIFQGQEGKYAKLINKIKSICTIGLGRDVLILKPCEEEMLRSLVANLLVRNPKNMKRLGLNDSLDDTIDQSIYNQIDSLLSQLGIGEAETFIKAARMKVTLTEEIEGSLPLKINEDLAKLNFTFLYANSDEFITSDIPIAFGSDIYAMGENKMCLYLALTPKIAILFGNYKSMSQYRNGLLPLNEKTVRKFNFQILSKKHYIRYIMSSNQEILQTYVREVIE